ncbi:DUF6482 family protein [Glaciecola sp. SC05]|uniref:DUF6482 family protein n=1 Tax=Glaciecola sp. SC05 TaxID=1987355 RepID=UPI0035275EF8
MNLFIESIEGGTYLAAIGDKRGTEYLQDGYRGSMQFQSLSELREQLSGRTFEKVWLMQKTPYDEMCGLETQNETLTIELDWD